MTRSGFYRIIFTQSYGRGSALWYYGSGTSSPSFDDSLRLDEQMVPEASMPTDMNRPQER